MPRHVLSLIVIAGSLLTGTGCSFMDRMRGENFADRDADWGESLREPGPEGELFGLSAKARQIERNVGIR